MFSYSCSLGKSNVPNPNSNPFLFEGIHMHVQSNPFSNTVCSKKVQVIPKPLKYIWLYYFWPYHVNHLFKHICLSNWLFRYPWLLLKIFWMQLNEHRVQKSSSKSQNKMNEFTFEISLSPDFFERHKYSMSQSKIALIIPESIKKFFPRPYPDLWYQDQSRNTSSCLWLVQAASFVFNTCWIY